MTEIDVLFLELMKVAIGNTECLSRQPSTKQWNLLYNIAKKQSLIGVCFAALQRLGADTNDGFARIGMCKSLYLTWMGMAAKIQQKNQIVDEECVTLQKRLSADGFRSCILKGQGVGHLYPMHLLGLRQCGDIDIYVDCGREKAVKYARSIQYDVDWDYKHLHLNVFEDTEVEMHYMPEISMNLVRNDRLQRWFKRADVLDSIFQNNGELVSPSVEFNLFYILLHTYRHFLYEGVGLRQLLDYYFVLKASFNISSSKRKDISTVIEQFGMKKFASGIMWIMTEVFGLEDCILLCAANEKEGRYILEQVMVGGNFGKQDERLANGLKGKNSVVLNVLRHNWHLLCHYPSEVLWSPIYILWHFCWKRFRIMRS